MGREAKERVEAESAARADPRVVAAVWAWSRRRWGLVVVAVLAFLHLAVVGGVADDVARALLLVHFGVVLLWQPFLHGRRRLSAMQVTLISLAAAAAVLWVSYWLLAFWIVLLVGMLCAQVYQERARWERRFYLGALVYLLALLTVFILPAIAPVHEILPEVGSAAAWGLPVLLAAMAFLPTEAQSEQAPQALDFFYGVFMMLALGVVIFGSFTWMALGRIGYLPALTATVASVAGALLLIALAWSPSSGYAGLNVFFSRHVLSVGLPAERWLQVLTELAQQEARTDRFLADAVAALARLPWVAGVDWRTAQASGSAGERSPRSVTFANSELALTIYSRHRESPALRWHLQLLAQLLGEFHLAKLREERLREAGYLRAVYETGARLTHDVKNLLQSLDALCAAAARDGAAPTPELMALFQRQLPAIARRLADTLAKFDRPDAGEFRSVPAQAWWAALGARYRGENVEFRADGVDAGTRVPEALFDRVADNLLRNALTKRALDPRVRVRAELHGGTALRLSVCDSGAAIAPEVQALLLRAPVASAGGLGIGLLQAARQAEARGYRLELASNRDGEVCFVLSGPPPVV